MDGQGRKLAERITKRIVSRFATKGRKARCGPSRDWSGCCFGRLRDSRRQNMEDRRLVTQTVERVGMALRV